MQRFGILGISGVVIDAVANPEEFKSRPALVGIAPTADHAHRFVVTAEPIKAGKNGRAVVAGVTRVRINVTDEAHQFAEIDPDQTAQLVSAARGSVSILYFAAGTSLQWGLVRLGGIALHLVGGGQRCMLLMPADLGRGGAASRRGEGQQMIRGSSACNTCSSDWPETRKLTNSSKGVDQQRKKPILHLLSDRFLSLYFIMRSKNKQRVTASEIARQIGVSRPVVSTVLSGGKSTIGVSDALRKEIRRVASELGYRPNAAARAMVRQKTQHVGVLIVNSRADPYTAPELYSTILGINFALEQTDYITSLIRIEDVRDAICTGSRALQEEVVDGVIVLGAVPADLREQIETLFRQVVWADTNVRDEVGCVTRDETGVGVMVGQEIARRGYDRAVLVTRTYDPQRSHYSLAHREEGLRKACEQESIGFEKLQVDLKDDIRRVRVNSDRLMGFPELVEGHLSKYMQPGVAMVALDETRAGIVTRVASCLRRRVGEDFGLVCCDGLTPKMHAVWPDLSQVAYDRYSAGELAAQLMLDALNSGGSAQPSKVLPLKWIEGNTLPSRSSRPASTYISELC